MKPSSISALLVAAVALSLSLWQHAVGTPRLDPRAYIERGDQVEQRYDVHSERLAKHYAALLNVVTKNAPDLLVYLQPPKSLAHGYQILPPIMRDVPVQKPAPTGPAAYSWPWTDRLLDGELREIVHSEAELDRIVRIAPTERTAFLEPLVQNYEQHSRRLQDIDAHIQYNRFWQAAIASDRARFDRETVLYRRILERQSIREGLNRVDVGLPISSVTFGGLFGLVDLTASLREREAWLTQQINAALQYVQIPPFVKSETFNNDWIFRLPLFTDIADRSYVTAVKEIIEAAWQLKDGKNSYRVKLHVVHISSAELYAGNEQPAAGQLIDIARHLGRFPHGGAILTTGARTTHVQGHAIVLGPHPVAPRVLAHEFGHILGFRDQYVRGYEDLGENGFQVVEIVADPEDIMAATANGVVKRSHFLQLLGGRRLETDLQFQSGFQPASMPPSSTPDIRPPFGGPLLYDQVRSAELWLRVVLMLASARRSDDGHDNNSEYG